jgi:hypothetical protein
MRPEARYRYVGGREASRAEREKRGWQEKGTWRPQQKCEETRVNAEKPSEKRAYQLVY